MAMDFDKEKQEVIYTGHLALDSLKKAKADLDSARNWGIYDIVGGGLLATMVKHGKMNSANENIKIAMTDLQKFRNELDDIDYANEDYMKLGELTMAADIIFDNVLTDLYVQSKINDLRLRVEEAIRRVERILKDVESN